MQSSTARDYLIDRALEIDNEQFEQLCKMVIAESERTRDLELTPFRRDGGIDIRAIIDRDLFWARLGVQVKQYSPGNTVGLHSIQRFKGALFDIDYQIGTYITLSSYSSNAVESAEQSYIRLIDGRDLASIMMNSELGIRDAGEFYEEEPSFWAAFEEPEKEGIIPTDEVPQADDLDVVAIALRAVDDGYDVRPEIAKYMEENARKESYDPRQGDYYPMACWVLGFFHKDREREYNGRTVRQFGLTREGEEYLELQDLGDEDAARQLLQEAIRTVEIIDRALDKLRAEGSYYKDDLEQLIAEETGLTGTTVGRRATTVGSWLGALDEVNRVAGQRLKFEYVSDELTDF